jgi:hypothetical protein
MRHGKTHLSFTVHQHMALHTESADRPSRHRTEFDGWLMFSIGDFLCQQSDGDVSIHMPLKPNEIMFERSSEITFEYQRIRRTNKTKADVSRFLLCAVLKENDTQFVDFSSAYFSDERYSQIKSTIDSTVIALPET